MSTLAFAGCGDEAGQTNDSYVAASVATTERACEKGLWRIASPKELDRVTLFLSHILVRHSGSASGVVPFDVTAWERATSDATRSRAQAATMAATIAAKTLHSSDSSFSAIARAYSDDELTRARGGNLGGLKATDLLPWPAVLDCMTGLSTGQTSQVVETEYGFHVFRHNEPPRPTWISARRIVIGYKGANWLEVVHRADKASAYRTREEASVFAASLVRDASAGKSSFAQLILEHSEHRDAVAGGRLGPVFSQTPLSLSREAQALIDLEEGQIAAPLDSPIGFQVLQRMLVETIAKYAMKAIRIPLNPASPQSNRSAHDRASKYLSIIRKDPAKFDELTDHGCCAEPVTWEGGAGLVANLAVGEIRQMAVESDGALVIAKRLDPATVPLGPRSLVMPLPFQVDIPYFFRSRDSSTLAMVLNGAINKFNPAADASASLLAINTIATTILMGTEARESASARAAVARGLLSQARGVLRPGDLHRYVAMLNSEIENQIMADP